MAYTVEKFGKPYKVVASGPINETMQYIEDALNEIDNKTGKIDEKIDKTEKGAAGGVATLDGNRKVPTEQIPDKAYSQVFEVNSLQEQLALSANIGDICKRADLLRTFVLKQAPADTFENWMEISAEGQVIPVSTVGITPFTTNFFIQDWESVPDSPGMYRLVYTESEHNLGANQQLYAFLKNADGNAIFADFTVDILGTVTILSDCTFDGYVIITNLFSNTDALNCVPYSINRAMIGSDNSEALFTQDGSSVTLNTTQPILLFDGFNNKQLINLSETFDVTELNGVYEIFIDSDDIVENNLTALRFISVDDYLGVVKRLPTVGSEGQRCYVAYGHSYEYSNGGWNLKAFTYTGRVVINAGTITDLYVQPYNQNGVFTNYLSSNKDYLFGSEINGLTIKFTSETTITVNVGECLSYDRQKILNLENTLVKNVQTKWAPGSNAGALIGELPVGTKWLHVFVIGDDFGNIDVAVSTEITPNLSDLAQFNHYRRIGTLPINNENSNIVNFEQQGEIFYKTQLIYNNTLSSSSATEIPVTDYLPEINNLTVLYGINLDTNATATIQSDNFTYDFVFKAGTFKLEKTTTLKVAVDSTTTGKVYVIGYIDKRDLWI